MCIRDSSNVKYNNLNDKFDEQSVRFDNFDKKFNEQKNEIRNSFDIKFDELKTEIKKCNDNFDKQCDEVIKRLDERLIQIKNQKVSNSENTTKNKVLINKVSKITNVRAYIISQSTVNTGVTQTNQ